MHHPQRVRLGKERAPQVVDPLHAVHEDRVARLVEAHMHDVALGGTQHDALDPLLALEGPHVGADDFHARDACLLRATVRASWPPRALPPRPPSNDRLKVRVFDTFVRYSRTTSPAVTFSS